MKQYYKILLKETWCDRRNIAIGDALKVEQDYDKWLQKEFNGALFLNDFPIMERPTLLEQTITLAELKKEWEEAGKPVDPDVVRIFISKHT